MDIYNCTDFKFAILNGRLKFPSHSATFIVKGSFDLCQKGQVSLSVEQAECNGDIYAEDDQGRLSGLNYPTDFAYFKPHIDFSVTGYCYTPQGKPLPVCSVRASIAEHTNTLAIFGDRYWNKSLLSAKISNPKPFTKMALTYKNSFGGKNYPANPVGKGDSKITLDNGEEYWPLPNIESIDNSIMSSGQKVFPAGFASYHSEWGYRKAKLGVYDDKWLMNRWPWFPENFDSSYFNSASPTMQIKDGLAGDEMLGFTNMHQQHSHYQTQLPGVRVRCFTRIESVNPGIGKSFQEISLKLDTLTVDMETESIVLIWRGWSASDSEEMEDIKEILIVSEEKNEPEKSLEECYALLKECQEKEAWNMEAFDSEAVEPVEADTKDDTLPTLEESLADRDSFKATALLQEKGISNDGGIPTSKQETEIIKQFVNALSGLDSEKSYKKTLGRVKQIKLKAGLGLDNEIVPSNEEKKIIQKLESEFTFNEEVPENALPRSREDLDAIMTERGSLAYVDLSQLDVKSIDFTSAVLIGADFSSLELHGVSFASADLTEAIFVEADISEADFHGACLMDVDFTSANLTEANLEGSQFNGAVFEACDLRAVNFKKSQGVGADFSKANLQGAIFENANLTTALFQESNLCHVSMKKALLNDAQFEQVSAMSCFFDEAQMQGVRCSGDNDFSRTSFCYAQLEGANFSGSNCHKANFSYTDMHDINFVSANLSEADFFCADIKFGNLSKANLENTRLQQANLFEGTLEKAKLIKTTFKGANLYGAELLDASIESVDFDQANLKMTKLDDRFKKS